MFCNRNKGFEKRARSGSGNGPGTSETVFFVCRFADRHFKKRFFEALVALADGGSARGPAQTSRRARPALDPALNRSSASGRVTVATRDPGPAARTPPRRPLVG